MSWRVAGSLERLLSEINAYAPNRSKASDGSIGDAAHASRASDHNPYIKDASGVGVVRARDFTHDPKGGFDSYAFARALAKTGDPRIRYIISNGEIFTPSVLKAWRKYTGSNPHDHHCHVSVSESAALYDDKSDWKWEVILGAPPSDLQVPGDRPVQSVPDDPILRRGSNGDAVRRLQILLKIKVDGYFGPATDRAVKAFQTNRNLANDGIVGPYTWRALRAADVIVSAASAPRSLFDRVMEYVIDDEGDEINTSPNEPGGASRYGVSIDAMTRILGRQATLNDLRALTPASASAVYRKLYADPIGFDNLPAGLNYAALDFAINSGIGTVDQVGIDDYLTIALREPNITMQIDRLCDLRLERMRANPDWPKYKSGWTARVARVRSRSYALTGKTLSHAA